MKHYLIIVCFLLSLNLGCSEKNNVNGVPNRPENFPDILVPVDGAIDILYLSPEIGGIAEGVYSITFWLDEEYPAANSIEQIQKHLQAEGCVRVNGSVLSDLSSMHIIEGEGFNKKVTDVTEEFQKSLKRSEPPSETQWRKPEPLADYANSIHSTWSQEWITQDDGLMSIHIQYYFPEKGHSDSQLWMHLILFTPSSWQYQHVLRYKENYPEQFNTEKGSGPAL